MTCSISCMPGPADRALVADDDDVAGLDLLGADGVVAGRLGVEHAGRAAVLAPLVAGQLDDAAVGRQRAVQDGQAAVRLERRLERADDLLAGRLDDVGRDLGDRPAVDGRLRRRGAGPGRLSSSRMTSATPPASYMSSAV